MNCHQDSSRPCVLLSESQRRIGLARPSSHTVLHFLTSSLFVFVAAPQEVACLNFTAEHKHLAEYRRSYITSGRDAPSSDTDTQLISVRIPTSLPLNDHGSGMMNLFFH
ncbi:unnamed protein product [Pleuronectes platessa]|uniref:Uncharacterized protein n=1 Tax=Pleuronectes platessa TaxID=8262 RepID=A0A9N7TM12_PLEPL|nr:unnamed protein product [Pleuronectes platessa]